MVSERVLAIVVEQVANLIAGELFIIEDVLLTVKRCSRRA